MRRVGTRFSVAGSSSSGDVQKAALVGRKTQTDPGAKGKGSRCGNMPRESAGWL